MRIGGLGNFVYCTFTYEKFCLSESDMSEMMLYNPHERTFSAQILFTARLFSTKLLDQGRAIL